MNTTCKDAVTAIIARLTTGWGTTTQIAFQGTKFTPNPKLAWIQPVVDFQLAEPASMGLAGLNRVVGDLHVNVFTPVGNGVDEAMGYVDQLRGLFPRGFLLPTATRTVTFEAPFPAPAIEQEDWHQIPVVCPFFCHELAA